MTKHKIKNSLKQLIPPFLLKLYGLSRSKERTGYPWEGIYNHYRDVPKSGSGYNSEVLVNQTFRYTRNALKTFKETGYIPGGGKEGHPFLALLVSLVYKDAGKVRVLDFGGGLGVAYIHLISNAVGYQFLDYHIVETEKTCQKASQLWEGDNRIHFHSSVPVDLNEVDVVYLSSVLQYVEDYRGLLKNLCGFNPKFFMFGNLSAGNIPTFATKQRNLAGTIMPYWMLNVDEIIETMARTGYKLIYKQVLERSYNQNNFPKKYRMDNTRNLLFVRNKTVST